MARNAEVILAPGLTYVRYEGRRYPAADLARGAAWELFATVPEQGFLRNPRPGAQWAYRKFVHATEVTRAQPAAAATSEVAGAVDETDRPLVAPVSRALTWNTVHRMSQIPPDRCDVDEAARIAMIRRTATISRGTHMMKVLAGRQVAGYLGGWPLAGFCYREYDLAHLRTPEELAPINGAPEMDDDVVFALRWRAVDPLDYAIPFDRSLLLPARENATATAEETEPAAAPEVAQPSGEVDITGLVSMPPTDRVGPQVLGTGFAPTQRHLIPEWVTLDFADLPLPVGASIVAYTSDGSEVVLYTYQPEQHAWLRMCGPQWRHLLARIPMDRKGDQEYFPVAAPPSRLVGAFRGQLLDAIADPPGDFRVAAKTRTARYPVEALARRCRYVLWRDVLCTVVRDDGSWRQLRLCHPDGEDVARLGAAPVERGVYEVWAPAAEAANERVVEFWYDLS